MEIIAILIVSALVLSVIAGYLWSVAWAIGDAQKRGQSGGFVLLLFWLFGPFAAFIWFLFRPKQTLIERSPTDYDDADDATAAASRLDSLGDWNAAIRLYRSVAERWPEHETYTTNCISELDSKLASMPAQNIEQ